MPNERHICHFYQPNTHQLISKTTFTWMGMLRITSDNGSIRLLVQFLAGPDVEPLTDCTVHCFRAALILLPAAKHAGQHVFFGLLLFLLLWKSFSKEQDNEIDIKTYEIELRSLSSNPRSDLTSEAI